MPKSVSLLLPGSDSDCSIRVSSREKTPAVSRAYWGALSTLAVCTDPVITLRTLFRTYWLEPILSAGYGVHLPDIGKALQDFLEAVLPECAQACHHGRVFYLGYRRPGLNQPLRRPISHQQFVQSDPAQVAGVIAVLAALRAEQRDW